jgi:putative spermidine/putrescine transport system substrate-binding protein
MSQRNRDEIPDEVLRRSFTRRDLIRRAAILGGGVAALGGASSLLAACGNSSPSSGGSGGGGGGNKRVVVADWGGAIQDAEKKHLYDPFTKETGIEVVISGPPGNAKIKAQVDSGNVEWDLVAGAAGDVIALGEDYFEPLPQRLLEIDGIDKKYVHSHALAYYVFSTNIGWNTDMLGSRRLENWADFWDTSAFPGKRTLAGIEGGNDPNLEFALLADGVPLDQLYPLDIDRAFKSLAKIKPSVAQWWASGSQPGQMLVGKQVSAAAIWIGRIMTLRDEKAPIDYTFNQGAIIPASWIVPKGAPNKEAAFQLAEYSVQPEVQARLWGSYVEGPTNSKSIALMDEAWAKQLPTHPDNAKLQYVRDEAWWGQNRGDVLKRFQQFVL